MFSSEITYQSLNGALSSRKCSIKASTNCKTSVYVLTDICLQCSKWLGPMVEYADRKKYYIFLHRLISWTRQMLQLYLIKSITSSVMGNQLNSIISFSFSPLQHIFRQYFTKHHSFFWKKMHKKFCICNDICNVAKISLKHFMSEVELYNIYGTQCALKFRKKCKLRKL